MEVLSLPENFKLEFPVLYFVFGVSGVPEILGSFMFYFCLGGDSTLFGVLYVLGPQFFSVPHIVLVFLGLATRKDDFGDLVGGG